MIEKLLTDAEINEAIKKAYHDSGIFDTGRIGDTKYYRAVAKAQVRNVVRWAEKRMLEVYSSEPADPKPYGYCIQLTVEEWHDLNKEAGND